MTLRDIYGRKHDYLRISVTDRCNLRCIYCMGADGVEQISHRDILRYEEIMQVVRVGAALGITKIRLTGGEPLVRKNIISLVEQIARVPGIEDISMTTNGILLSRYAADLKKAGLKRVNISLDSLDSKVYRRTTRGGDLEQVLSGIDAALMEDLTPVKVNVVLMNGLNDKDIPAFLQLANDKPLHVRFIEYMPIGDHDRVYQDRYLPLDSILEMASAREMELTPNPAASGGGPSENYILPEGKGTIGLIHPISKHFCSTCNRLRLTADGLLKPCLYWQEEYPVRPALGDEEAISSLLQEVLLEKKSSHQMNPSQQTGNLRAEEMRGMSRTGG